MTPSIRFAVLALAAAGVTACEFAPAESSISAVVVAPALATISTGESVHLNATVTAVPTGTAYTVVWTSADLTGATVDSTGLVVGMTGSSGVSICATASAGGSSMKSCSTVVVVPAPACPGPSHSTMPPCVADSSSAAIVKR